MSETKPKTPDPATDFARYRLSLQDEIDSAFLYRALAEAERGSRIGEVYQRLAAVEEKHAAFWADELRKAGQPVPQMRPGWRPRTLAWLARRFGTDLVLPSIAGLEAGDSADYGRQPETRTTAMPAEEKSHGRVLRHILNTTRGGLEGPALARLEGRHKAVGGNALRAAVLGANDGLVSNLSLVMGVAGASLSNQSILITGFAGLLAGAISMALGEWLSVQSSRELYKRQIDIEAGELHTAPAEEADELALIYEAKGVRPDEAKRLAQRLIQDESQALDTLAREELGIDPESLGGSAWEAAISSFLLFAVGAIIPVWPFLLFTGTTGVAVSLASSSLGLFAIGAAITLMTGRGLLFSGLRQTLFGLAAAAVTFGIGKLVGVSLAG